MTHHSNGSCCGSSGKSFEKFWVSDICALFSSLRIFPKPTESREERFNALSRLIIVLSLILYLFAEKFSFPFLSISLFFLIILFYTQRMNPERYRLFTPDNPLLIKGDSYSLGAHWTLKHGPPNPKTALPPVIPPSPVDTSVWGNGNYAAINSDRVMPLMENEVSDYDRIIYNPNFPDMYSDKLKYHPSEIPRFRYPYTPSLVRPPLPPPVPAAADPNVPEPTWVHQVERYSDLSGRMRDEDRAVDEDRLSDPSGGNKVRHFRPESDQVYSAPGVVREYNDGREYVDDRRGRIMMDRQDRQDQRGLQMRENYHPFVDTDNNYEKSGINEEEQRALRIEEYGGLGRNAQQGRGLAKGVNSQPRPSIPNSLNNSPVERKESYAGPPSPTSNGGCSGGCGGGGGGGGGNGRQMTTDQIQRYSRPMYPPARQGQMPEYYTGSKDPNAYTGENPKLGMMYDPMLDNTMPDKGQFEHSRDVSLPSTLQVEGPDERFNRSDKFLHRQTEVVPNFLTSNEIIEPINSNNGISYLPQNYDLIDEVGPTSLNHYTYTRYDPQLLRQENDLSYGRAQENPVRTAWTQHLGSTMAAPGSIPIEQIYDPRFSGYGDGFRSYYDLNSGRSRYYYRNVEAYKYPNFVVKSKVDHIDFMAPTGAVWAQYDLKQEPADYKALVEDQYIADDLFHREDMMSSLMAKSNRREWQLRIAPKRSAGTVSY